jgi:hypothetical protein
MKCNHGWTFRKHSVKVICYHLLRMFQSQTTILQRYQKAVERLYAKNNHRATTLLPSSKKHMVLRTLQYVLAVLVLGRVQSSRCLCLLVALNKGFFPPHTSTSDCRLRDLVNPRCDRILWFYQLWLLDFSLPPKPSSSQPGQVHHCYSGFKLLNYCPNSETFHFLAVVFNTLPCFYGGQQPFVSFHLCVLPFPTVINWFYLILITFIFELFNRHSLSRATYSSDCIHFHSGPLWVLNPQACFCRHHV